MVRPSSIRNLISQRSWDSIRAMCPAGRREGSHPNRRDFRASARTVRNCLDRRWAHDPQGGCQALQARSGQARCRVSPSDPELHRPEVQRRTVPGTRGLGLDNQGSAEPPGPPRPRRSVEVAAAAPRRCRPARPAPPTAPEARLTAVGGSKQLNRAGLGLQRRVALRTRTRRPRYQPRAAASVRCAARTRPGARGRRASCRP